MGKRKSKEEKKKLRTFSARGKTPEKCPEGWLGREECRAAIGKARFQGGAVKHPDELTSRNKEIKKWS